MAYTKPGVEISQIQQSATPIFAEADLSSVIVGPGYHIQPATEAVDSAGDAIIYSGVALTVDLDEVNSSFSTVDSADQDLIYVDFIGTKGGDTGKTFYLENGTDFTTSTSGVSFVANLSNYSDSYSIKIGYRALRDDLDNYRVIEGYSDLESRVGLPMTYNPLAFGTKIALDNAGTSIGIYGTDTLIGGFDTALSALEVEDVYCIAPMSHLDNLSGALKTHCESMSEPEAKKERIGIISRQISAQATTGNYRGASENKTAIAGEVRDANSAVGSKRIVMTYPDIVYVNELRHISTIKQGWIQDSFAGMGSSNIFETANYNLYARFIGNIEANGVVYGSGEIITDDAWNNLIAEDIHELNVSVPVPGWAYSAAVAGQSAGEAPEQPFTNVSIAGLGKTYGSQDHFTEAQLNTMASGGTYIMTQDTAGSPIKSRHQVTTDITSVAKRELSITRAIDASAKFIRDGVSPYIGKYNISPSFLKLLNSVIVGQGLFLVRNGTLNDFKLSSLKVDELSPDTIRVSIDLLPKYPVNYIKIELVF
ncbi:hypothetical protein H8D85_01050 [bacterium]|nr:hypothetical protein [bacterium]